jgi:hypothetical protein
MASSAVLLYTVLTEEYESQGLEPSFPRQELEAQFEQKLPELDAKLGPLRLSDPEEYERRLDAERVKLFYAWLHKNDVRRSALCFSGGGIRSATFGLGLVQGLARRRLLGQFNYLSTVSGGGYLGSWLTGWIYRERKKRAEAPERQQLAAEERQRLAEQDAKDALQEVETRLENLPGSSLGSSFDQEPEPVRYLRKYSRYMSPKVGLLSADTWTLVSIFLRNLFLNWLVLLPLLALGLMIPRVSVILVRLGTRPWFQAREEGILQVVFWLAVAFGSCSIAYIAAARPSLAAISRLKPKFRGQLPFLLFCQLPLTLMAILITLYWAWLRSRGTQIGGLRFVILGWETSPLVGFVLFGMILHLGGFLLSRYFVRSYVLGEFSVTLATGALGGLGAWLAATKLFPDVTPGLSEIYACFAAPLLLFLFLLAATLFVGLSSYYTSDADREWLARAGAWILIVVAVRSVLFALVVFGPVALLHVPAWIASIGGVSGLITLILGRSSGAKGRKDQQEKGKQSATAIGLDKLLVFAAPVFAASILVVLAELTTQLIRWLAETRPPARGPVWPDVQGLAIDHSWLMPLKIVYDSPWWTVVVVSILFAVVGGFMGWFVDINRFSLHAAYRDRLIRAYLGASRGSLRRPNPFTGFDEDDNVQMQELRSNRPFHVVNMALNLVSGKDLAWQDRKAETFTASPLHAGSFRLGYRDTAEYGLHRGHQNVAISLGTAVAISGAAASPNMGYHSSPVVTFLLALFNVRLGWWLGNPGPAGKRTYNTPGPRFAPRSLFAEAFGLTDNDHPYVYLTDGGHFENLGLYEMILRRCRFIVVSDGGQDAEFTFEDLGNALSKIRVDLGVPIKFGRIPLRARPAEQESYDPARDGQAGRSLQSYCAIARICYSCVDSVPGGAAEDGFLLYIKPALNGSEPADVFHYARLHPQFPHESTAQQLYTESQFESYRELGSHIMRTILEQLPAGGTLDDQFFEKISSQLGEMPVCD